MISVACELRSISSTSNGSKNEKDSSVDETTQSKIKTQHETFGTGCLLQAIGIGIVWIWPIGTVIGIPLIIIGQVKYKKLICSECGNPVDSKQVKLCPACRAKFK